jgi:hypothetical protein
MSLVSPSRGQRRCEPLIAVLICLGCLVPFVNKAFTIDDPLFLWAAQHIQQHPFDPYGFTVNWYTHPERMADVTKNPPLACYALALAGWLFGWSEVALHTAFLLPAAGAAWGTYRLAEKLCTRPLLATLAGVLTPVFLVSSTNVMCDTMMLCFWVWSLVCWRRGLERPAWLIVAGALISLCALTKYFGVSLIPLLLVYTLLARRHMRAGLTALFIPIAALTAYQLATLWMYQRGLLLDAIAFSVGARGEHGRGWLTPLIGLAFTGGCLISVLFYLPLLWPRQRPFAFLALAAALLMPVLALPLVAGGSEDRSRLLQAALFLLGGLAVAVLAVADLLRRRDADAWLLFLWVAGTLAFGIAVNWVINGRSLLPLAPAAGILIARRLSSMQKENPVFHSAFCILHSTLAYVPLAPAAAVALLVTAADYRQAGADRDAARLIADACAGQPGTLWFEGHWGFQYYLQKRGGVAVDQREKGLCFHKNDFIALPNHNYGVLYEPPTEAVCEVLIIEQPSFSLAGTMNEEQGAGFYSHVHGMLPFVFGSAAPLRYRVLRFITSVPAADGETRRETER